MNHSIHRVTGVRIDGEYTLEVEFSDGTRQKIDFQPIMAGEIYGPLLDRSLFDKEKVDPEAHTLVWPNGTDFDPAILHDWPACEKAFRKKAKQWDTVHKQRFASETAATE